MGRWRIGVAHVESVDHADAFDRLLRDAIDHDRSRDAGGLPEDPRFSYVYGVALHDTGKQPEAIETLKSALSRHPYDRDILWILATYEIESGDYASALRQTELLNQLEPNRSDVAGLLEQLRRQPR